MLYILCGIPFSGKTTLAKQLVETCKFIRIDLDEIKCQLYGSQIKDSQLNQSDWDIIYQHMYTQIKSTLVEGQTVIHDTGNFTRHERELVRQIATNLNLPSLTIFVNTNHNTAHSRLIANRISPTRFDVSDTDFTNTISELEPPDTTESHLIINETDHIPTWIKNNIK